MSKCYAQSSIGPDVCIKGGVRGEFTDGKGAKIKMPQRHIGHHRVQIIIPWRFFGMCVGKDFRQQSDVIVNARSM